MALAVGGALAAGAIVMGLAGGGARAQAQAAPGGQPQQTIGSAQQFLQITLNDGAHYVETWDLWPPRNGDVLSARITLTAPVAGDECRTRIEAYAPQNGKSYIRTIVWSRVTDVHFVGRDPNFPTAVEIGDGVISSESPDANSAAFHVTSQEAPRLWRAFRFLSEHCDTRKAATGF